LIKYSKQDLEGTGFGHLHLVEKVFRIIGLLKEINKSEFLNKAIALKGGTALNIFYWDIPRLSIDLDFNYVGTPDKERMEEDRNKITILLKSISAFQGYQIEHQADKYAQDRFVMRYGKYNGGNETLEVEINYMLRVPLFGVQRSDRQTILNELDLPIINILSSEEIAGSKFCALLFRATPRDLFDAAEIIRNISKVKYKDFRSAFIFYCSIQSEGFIGAKRENIANLNKHIIKTQLLQQLRFPQLFNLDKAIKLINPFLDKLLDLTDKEKEYLNLFSGKIFKPELLFDSRISLIKKHPQVAWLFSKR